MRYARASSNDWGSPAPADPERAQARIVSLMTAEGKRRLVDVDERALIADYEANADATDAICATHQIGLTRLYRILDRNQIPRRRPNAARLPKRPRERILRAYTNGDDVAEIARRHRVAPSTVSSLAVRQGISRVQQNSRDEPVELVVRYLRGDDLTHDQREAIRRVGCRTRLPGLRTLEHPDAAIIDKVKRRLVDALNAGDLATVDNASPHPT